MDKWERITQEQTVDIHDYARQAYLGPTVPLVPAPFHTTDDWAAWVLSFDDIWQDDAAMEESPLEVHCSRPGGGLLSGERDYDIFLQNHAQIKVYGPSLAITDDWDAHVTQLGLTKSVHEYSMPCNRVPAALYSGRMGSMEKISSIDLLPSANVAYKSHSTY